MQKFDIYAGLSARKDNFSINIHFLDGDRVFYGKYDDRATENPFNCVGMYRTQIDKFQREFFDEIAAGAIPYTLIREIP